MSDTTERLEIYGKRGWYYSWGAFMVFDAGVHFFVACMLFRILWMVANSSMRYTDAYVPQYREGVVAISLACCYCMIYGYMCLDAAWYCLKRLREVSPVMVVDLNGIEMNTLYQTYSIAWENVSSIRQGKLAAGKKFTAISLKSEGALYSKKHSPWLRLEIIRNKLFYKAPIILPSTSGLGEPQSFSSDRLLPFYEQARDE